MTALIVNTRIEEIAERALSEGKKLGCSDVSIIAGDSTDSQVRFSNNSITLVNTVRNITVSIYLAKDKKRIVGETYNPSEEGLSKFIQNLLSSAQAMQPSDDYTPLPEGPFHYNGQGNFDPKVVDCPFVDYAKQAIDQGLKAGSSRVSGSVNTNSTELFIRTTGGASGRDRQSMLLLNARAFSDDNASGHGLSCSSYESDFRPEAAGFTAGHYAKKSRNPSQVQEGKYNVVFTPTVVANMLPIAQNASAFSIESGLSFLVDKLDERIGVQTLQLEDRGVYKKGLGGRIFDDEGLPTETTEIVGDGTFRRMLHNSTTARKFGAQNTANAGIVAPRPETIVYGEGQIELEDMIRQTGRGLFITNNWYTRYQNIRTGEYSTVPRDAAFMIEDGELKEPVAGLRVSDSIPRQLANIEFISPTRQWIKWWEVAIPTFAPAMMVRDVLITRAVGS